MDLFTYNDVRQYHPMNCIRVGLGGHKIGIISK